MLKRINYHGKELLSPKSDIVFKALFGNDKTLLKSLINDVLELEVKSEDDITIINSEVFPENKDDYYPRMDLRVKVGKEKIVHIEIQILDEKNIIPRSVYYQAKNIGSSMERCNSYKEMPKTISLIFLDFLLFKESEKWYNNIVYWNETNNEKFTDMAELIFIELPKVKKICEKKEKLSDREKWCMFLSATEGSTLDMLVDEKYEFKRALGRLNYVSEEEEIRFRYEMQEKATMDYYSRKADEESTKRELEEMRKEVEDRKKEVEDQKKEVEDQKKEVEDQKKEVEDQKKEVEDWKKEVEDQKKEVAEQQKDLAKQQRSLDEQKKEIEELKKNIGEQQNIFFVEKSKIINNMKKSGMDISQIAEVTGIEENEIEKYY